MPSYRKLQTVDPTLIVPVRHAGGGAWGVNKTYDLIAAGELESLKIGKCRYVTVRSIKKFIERGIKATPPITPEGVARYSAMGKKGGAKAGKLRHARNAAMQAAKAAGLELKARP